MKNIFIFTDNFLMYKKIKEIINNKVGVSASFFCSPKSEYLFKTLIKNKEIVPKLIKENESFFIKNFSLGLSCHSKQIFPRKLVNSILCVNIHPGLNPHNRGWYPQVFSIINGLPAGATLHIMDEEIDHGDIIDQEEVEVLEKDNSLTLYNRVQNKEIHLLEKNIDSILAGSFTSLKPELDGNYNSIKDFKKLTRIDLDRKTTMREVINYLRALTHPPYSNAFFYDVNGKKIEVSILLSSSDD